MTREEAKELGIDIGESGAWMGNDMYYAATWDGEYDGAPDSPTRNDVGMGDTIVRAIADLLNITKEHTDDLQFDYASLKRKYQELTEGPNGKQEVAK